MKIKLLLNNDILLTCFIILGIMLFSNFSVSAQSTVYTEDFETFTIGTTIGDDADWYDNSGGPVIGAANGVAGSQGLGAANNIFTWSTHTFDWNADDFVSVAMQMDFKTDSEADFNDDRIGWMINNPTTSSSNIMGVQLEPGGSGGSGHEIEGYWDGVSATDKRPNIVDIPALSANTWYRFWVKFTKLTATSCRIDVSLTELDGSGNPTGTPITGSIANTSTLGEDEPNAKYFTSGLSPAYKNFTADASDADNAYYEIVTDGLTAIWSEDFPYSDGTIQGSGTPSKWTRDISGLAAFGAGDYFEVRNNLMEGRDLDGEAIWTTEAIDISGFTGVKLSVDITAYQTSTGLEPNDHIRTYYILDGGSETLFETNGDLSDDLTGTPLETASLPAIQTGINGSSVIIRLRLENNSDSERYRFDNIKVRGSPATNPTITITDTPLNPFYSNAGISSAEQSYTVDGSNLTENILITAPTDFEVSTSSGTGFVSSVELTQSGGSVDPTTVYVRFNRGVSGSSSGDIVHTSAGANTENVSVSGTATAKTACEDFNLFTTGNVVGSDADWFDNGSGPVVQSTIGVASSQGLAPGSSIFTWTANPFDWNAPDFTGIKVQMDFQADASGEFDDDRVGWMIDNTSSSSDFIFGVQLDNKDSHLRMETYWDNEFGDNAGRVEMADLDAVTINSNGWYRLIADISKLDASSASIFAELWSLDGSGNIVSMVANGSVPNTSLVGSGTTPNSGYFSGPIWPAFKNHTGSTGAADNACFEFDEPLPVELSSFTGSVFENKVQLRWKTETEVNNYGFEIERKAEKSKWQNVGFIEGHGNSNSPKSYSYLDDSFSAGKYEYRLKQIDNDGKFEYSKIIEIELTPVEYSLFQNYPNPFNPSTTIKYALPQSGNVKIVLFNMLGEEVAVLINEVKEAGIHTIDFNAKDLGSGIYFYKFESSNFVSIKKMILVK